VTRAEAANFFYGIRLLSGERRRAICAVYAFARRVDDIGDGDLPVRRSCTSWRARRLRCPGSRAPPRVRRAARRRRMAHRTS